MRHYTSFYWPRLPSVLPHLVLQVACQPDEIPQTPILQLSPGALLYDARLLTSLSIAVLDSGALCAGAQLQVAAFAADKQSLQEKLNQHLEAAQSSTAAMHAELSSLRDKAAKSEAAVADAQNQVRDIS